MGIVNFPLCSYVLDSLINLFYFLSAIIITVSIHEAAHMITALLCGVKVEAYSIGFGKPLLEKTIKGIKFRLSLILLGGYTKLSGELEKSKNGFLVQPYWKKFLILISGVVSNLILASICYLILYGSIKVGFWFDLSLFKSIITKNTPMTYLLIMSLGSKTSLFLVQLSLINTVCSIFNLLPFPALDGGSIWLLWLEKIYKERFPIIWRMLCTFGFWFLNAAQFVFIYWLWFVK